MDFDDFMKIAPCTRGRHNAKAVAPKPQQSSLVARLQASKDQAPQAAPAPVPAAAAKVAASDCPRCKSGFMCQEHGKTTTAYKGALADKRKAEQAAKEADPTVPRACKNTGCDVVFLPADNADDACRHHPGPPVFHDAAKKWGCCGKSSHDFDEWLKIPGCATGRHK